MNFPQSVKTALITNYAKFSGRASRSEFWWFVLFYLVLKILLSRVGGLMAASPINALFLLVTSITENEDKEMIVRACIFVAIDLALILPFFGLMARRLHDRNLSGWWILLYLVQSYILEVAVNYAVMALAPRPLLLMTGFLFSIFIYLIALIPMAVFFIQKGTQGPNRYGKDPRQANEIVDIFT